MSLPITSISTLTMLCLLHAGGTQAQSVTTKDMSGRWESPAPVFDEATKLYGSYVFEFNAKQWTHTFTASADAAGQQKLFSYRVAASGYMLGQPVAGIYCQREGWRL